MGMKLKKPMKVNVPAPAAASPAGGSATIADRFKLEPVQAAAPKGGTVNKTAALIALVAAFIALVASGALTFMLYQHWEFLKLA